MITDPIDRHYGIYRGVCWNNRDPEGRGRIQVKVASVTGDEISDWAWPSFPPNWRQGLINPLTDPQGGTLTPSLIGVAPAAGTGVWVMYEAGDPAHPVYIGTF